MKINDKYYWKPGVNEMYEINLKESTELRMEYNLINKKSSMYMDRFISRQIPPEKVVGNLVIKII